jgi:hypothetical protein
MWPVLRCYRQVTKLAVEQFCMGVCEERTRVHKTEDSPLLDVVPREQLMKTQQAGKMLSRCCGDM